MPNAYPRFTIPKGETNASISASWLEPQERQFSEALKTMEQLRDVRDRNVESKADDASTRRDQS